MNNTVFSNTPAYANKHGFRKGELIKAINSQRHRIGTQSEKQDESEKIVSHIEEKYGYDNEMVDILLNKLIHTIKEKKIDIMENPLTIEQMFGNM